MRATAISSFTGDGKPALFLASFQSIVSLNAEFLSLLNTLFLEGFSSKKVMKVKVILADAGSLAWPWMARRYPVYQGSCGFIFSE
ncbi:MAG: hypothetical protein MRZ79_13880 [Bacteroidia bacterium]|nr:hypothetical protein [Bacteroidia bacterium]